MSSVLHSALLVAALSSHAPGQELEWAHESTTGRLVTGGYLTVRGWAFDGRSGEPPPKAEVFLDGAVRGDVLIRQHRLDIATARNRPEYLWSGWVAFLSLRDIAPGKHRLDMLLSPRSGPPTVFSRQVLVRSFPSPYAAPEWRTHAVLLLRTILVFFWLTFLGWGPLRWVHRGANALLAPGAGLALLAIAIELGALLGVRPLGSAFALTALSLLLLGLSFRTRRARPRRPSTATIATLALALLFVVVAAAPLAAHGEGAVLGRIVDAAWESSVGDSIARYGWTLPAGVDGHWIRVPAEWRSHDFRAGAPYLLALLAQTFVVRSHEAYSVLILLAGALVICATGALSGRVFRGRTVPRFLAIALAASSSVLFAALYNQHAGILIATVLFLLFLFYLLTLLRSGKGTAVLLVAVTIAAGWTLYPETMVLWVSTAALSILLAGSRQRMGRTALRLLAAALLAAALNPTALARTVRFQRKLVSAPVLATPDQRTGFGDIHYFPSLRVAAGIEPLRLDAPVLSSWRVRALRGFGVMTLVLFLPVGFLGLERGQRKLLLLFMLPPAVWLLANRLLPFPYGYSKVLQHAAAIWPLALALLAEGVARYRKSAAIAVALFLLSLSVWSARDTVSRALRSVPSFDPAFRALDGIGRNAGRDAVLVTSEPDFGHREWMAYFLGDRLLVPLLEGETLPADLKGRTVYRLRDQREEGEPLAGPNPFFTLVRVPS